MRAARGLSELGDRHDDDILPAAGAEMITAFLRRGPWGLVGAW